MKLFVRPTKFALVVAGVIGGVSSLSAQSWKWEQLPDLSANGVDVLATFNTGSTPATKKVMLADQFVCGLSGPIVGIRFWGSWLNNVSDPNVKFSVSIMGNNVNNTPGVVGWTSTLSPNNVTQTASIQQMFWDPSTPAVIPGANTTSFQYDFVNPLGTINGVGGLAFQQVAGTTYWLTVQASTADGKLFGWKTSALLDGTAVPAMYGTNTTLGSTRTIAFKDMYYPAGVDQVGLPIDLAFALDTPEPTTAAVLVVGLAALLWRRKSVA